MKLTELAPSKKTSAQRALREHYEVNVDLDRLDSKKTRSMLTRVRGLISEARTKTGERNVYNDPSFNKLMMMEQMLSTHYDDLRTVSRIVVENEEVQKSQVILAAQDMIDQIQKMIEQVSKMNAEELPAVVTGITNEIGTTESEQFNTSAGQAITTLQQSLSEAKSSLTTALSTVTGESVDEVPEPFDAASDDMDMDMDMAPSDDEVDVDVDVDAEEMPELPDLDDDEDLGGAGRELR
jgi:hypothetical protein